MGNCREPRGEAEQQLGAAAEAGKVEGLLGGGQVWLGTLSEKNGIMWEKFPNWGGRSDPNPLLDVY